MLKDLPSLLAELKAEVNSYDLREVALSEEFKSRYTEVLNQAQHKSVTWHSQTLTLKTRGGLTIVCPFQWIILARITFPFIEALLEYKAQFEHIFAEYDARSRRELSEEAKEQHMIPPEVKEKIREKIADATDQGRFIAWLTDYASWDGAKTIHRGDFINSPVLKIANVVQDTQGFITDIANHFASTPELAELLPAPRAVQQQEDEEPVIIHGGQNKIIYGAPGTGKSYTAHQNHTNIIRTVFHPDTTMQDFVGTYRPCKIDGEFTYEFTPGPFVKALTAAINTPEQMHTLLIEELNRANASAVFGEIFQLLDRDSTGKSEYCIPAEEALSNYMKSVVPGWNGELCIPSNLSIVATMNSADQGVFPLDSAFKRRWTFEYLPIDFENARHKDALLKYAGTKISWQSFGTAINDKLAEIGINEDRHIGPYFLKEGDVANPDTVASKLLIYLWDDVVRHQRTSMFSEHYRTFASLIQAFKAGEEVFAFAIPALAGGQDDAGA